MLTKTSNSPMKMSEDEVWPFWTVLCTLKETLAQTSRSTENPLTQTNTFFLTTTTHWNTSYV